MLAAAHADELRRALAALAAVIGERTGGARPLPPESSAVAMAPPPESSAGATAPPPESSSGATPPPLEGDEGLPPSSAFAGDGPLAAVIAELGLPVGDAVVLVAALAPEIDARYAALYPLVAGRAGTGLTGEAARNLAARTLSGRLAAAERLSAGAPLRACGLLRLEAAADGLLAGRLRIDPDLAVWLLGRSRELPDGSGDFPAAPLATVHSLADVIVPSPVRDELTGLVTRIRNRRRVTVEWGFDAHHDGVSGVVALFHGPSGTGKTMAAAVVAREAGLPAFRIDLSALVSKYIGETEKNLERVFDVAERGDCVLVFDEADAVFGRRTEVHEARDRYANQEISYLLQRIERHPGVVILTTNLLGNVDDAFQRRIDVVVAFPAPTRIERRRLWRSVPPPGLPLAPALELDRLADRFDLTGAQIRDATLEAAYIAAADGGVVTLQHVEAGVRRQYAKAGLMLPPEPR
jgi:hypothetical protein